MNLNDLLLSTSNLQYCHHIIIVLFRLDIYSLIRQSPLEELYNIKSILKWYFWLSCYIVKESFRYNQLYLLLNAYFIKSLCKYLIRHTFYSIVRIYR
jgi:hypothetical protein